jgi:hypothetical protein
MALVAGAKTFGVLGQILPRCATVLEAYHQTARYSALASQGAFVSVARNADMLIVSLAMPNLREGEVPRTIMLWGLTNLCLTPQRLARTPIQPTAVTCTFSPPDSPARKAASPMMSWALRSPPPKYVASCSVALPVHLARGRIANDDAMKISK